MFVNGDGQGLTSDTTARAAQIVPGFYNETVLKRFDSIIWMAGEATHHKMLIIHETNFTSVLTSTGLPADKSVSAEGLCPLTAVLSIAQQKHASTCLSATQQHSLARRCEC